MLSACVFAPGPAVDCQSVSADDCDRAVEMARPLLSSHWGTSSRVIVHIGPCTQGISCPPTVALRKRFLTVELTPDERQVPYVVIDRQDTEWTATCFVFVYSGSEGHTQACGG
jgi:hypothetical protein